MSKIEYIGKCLFVEQDGKKIIVIGDLHLGYEEAMRSNGVVIPSNAFEDSIKHLGLVFDRVGKVDEIVLLGDLKHEFGRISREEWNDVSKLIEYLQKNLVAKGKIVIIKGNHDAIIQPIANKNNIEVKSYEIVGEFCFLHGDSDYEEVHEKGIKYWIMGHAHPAIVLRENSGVKTEKYKCFLIGEYKKKKVIILPSFFPLIEGTDVSSSSSLGLAWNFNLDKFEVKIVDSEEDSLKVLDFGKLGKISK